MLKILEPVNDQWLTFSRHVSIWVKSGSGLLEVDFRTYRDFENRLIFLSPGQSVRFPAGEFELALLEFPDAFVSESRDYRVLFKHLVSLGYVEFSDAYGTFPTLLETSPSNILDTSSRQWFLQNPFNANRDEYDLLFDLKELVDARFAESRNVERLLAEFSGDARTVRRLVKSRLGVTIKNMLQRKLLIESRKRLAFTDSPVQQIAYELGFDDPAYFNRFFRGGAGITPLEFRAACANGMVDTFVQELLELIRRYHTSERSVLFYADRMHVSVKTLARNVKNRLGVTAGELIRAQVADTAKSMLQQTSVRETAFALGFEEANHFSAFFRKRTGMTPSEFRLKKCNS